MISGGAGQETQELWTWTSSGEFGEFSLYNNFLSEKGTGDRGSNTNKSIKKGDTVTFNVVSQFHKLFDNVMTRLT